MPPFPIKNLVSKQWANCITYKIAPEDLKVLSTLGAELLDRRIILNKRSSKNFCRMYLGKKEHGRGSSGPLMTFDFCNRQ